ncbi:MAG: Lrp/AsnC ligand binding domain-containing protein [Nitrosopumilaceae archaeon]
MAKAFVLINCEPGSDDYVVSKLRSIETVKSAYGIFGLYDVIAQLESNSEENLENDITEKVRNLEKILGTTTLIAESGTDMLAEIFAKKQENLKDKNTAKAYVVIRSDKVDEYNILHDLSKIPEVIDGNAVVGYYEIICKVAAPTYNDIEDVITKKIRKLNNVNSTVTLNVIPYKRNN